MQLYYFDREAGEVVWDKFSLEFELGRNFVCDQQILDRKCSRV